MFRFLGLDWDQDNKDCYINLLAVKGVWKTKHLITVLKTWALHLPSGFDGQLKWERDIA